MSLPDAAAALLFVGVVAYAILGGADFGSGVWDLLAGDARNGAHLRSQIDRSIGPVWEANHVWLIYVLVFLWTGFPTAFGAIMTTLFVPWLLVGLGIVLRGGAFAFRKFSSTVREARLHGVVFAASSVVTPFFLGMIAGAVASGRVPADGTGDVWRSWTGPTSWVGGTLAVLTVAFLAATFLAADAERGGRTELADDIGTKALWAGVVTGPVALAAAVAIELDAETLADGLHTRGLALVLLSAASGMATLVLLKRRRWALARPHGGRRRCVDRDRLGRGPVRLGVGGRDDDRRRRRGPIHPDRADRRIRLRRSDGRAGHALALRARQPGRLAARMTSCTLDGSRWRSRSS